MAASLLKTVIAGAVLALLAAAAGAAQPYDFGNPSPTEEAMRQAIQRARNDPEAEADRAGLNNTHSDDTPNGTYDIGEGITSIGVADQADYWARYQGPRQYLAWSGPLNTAAGHHADDMFTHSFFSHRTKTSSYGYTPGEDLLGDGPAERGYADGYVNHFIGENIAVNNSAGEWAPEFIHTDGFFTETNVPGRGHRRNMLRSTWREIGVGYVVGPPNDDGWTDHWVVDFASDAFARQLPPHPSPDPWPPIDTVFATGVFYHDGSGDGAYQAGEERPGRRVFARVGTSWLKYYAVTADGGGYSLPLLDAAGADLPGGTQVELIFFDPQLKAAWKVTRTLIEGDVVFEDTESETPETYNQRFNIGQDAEYDDLSAVLPGDVDFDGSVDIMDLVVLANNYSDVDKEWIDGDFTGDGVVNVMDLAQLANYYGRTAGGSAVPEPATLLLLFLGASLCRRRGR